MKSLLSVGVRVMYLSNYLNQWNKRTSQDHSTARSNGTRWSKVIGRHLPIRTVAWHDHNVAVNHRAKMSASNKCQEILGTLSASISQAKGPWVRDLPSTVYNVWPIELNLIHKPKNSFWTCLIKIERTPQTRTTRKLATGVTAIQVSEAPNKQDNFIFAYLSRCER